jgi:hypothetical protein
MTNNKEHKFEKLVKDYCSKEGKDTALCHLFKFAPEVENYYLKESTVKQKSCSSCLGSRINSNVTASDPCSPCNNNPLFCALQLFSDLESHALPKLTDHDIQLILNQLALPTLPSALLATETQNFITAFTNRIIAYEYLPLLLITILCVWLIVAAGWISIFSGFILTIIFLAIVYFFYISFKVSIQAYVSNFVNTSNSAIEDYRDGVKNAIKRLPATIGLAICLLVGSTYNPNKPTCPTFCS